MADEPNKGGRPSKLTPELQAEVVKLVEAGDAIEVAAGVCGVDQGTLHRWIRRGKTGEEPYGAFASEVARARCKFESEMRRRVLEGDGQGVGFGQSKAALEVLSRRVPRRWAARVKHEIEESNRLMLDVLERVCRDPDVFERVRQEEDCSAVFASVCEELARLDSEGEAAVDQGESGERVH